MKGTDKYNLIERYLSGNLQADEKSMFHELMTNDPELTAFLENHYAASELIMAKDMLSVKQKLNKIHHGKSVNIIKSRILRWSAIAATGAIIGALVLLDKNNQTDQIADKKNYKDILYDEAKVLDKPNNPHPIAQQNEEILADKNSIKASKSNKSEDLYNNIEEKNTDENILNEELNNEMIGGGIQDSSPLMNKDSSKALHLMAGPEPEKSCNKKNADTSIKSPIVSCEHIHAKFETEASCYSTSNGRISILENSIEGGNAPYLFCLDGRSFSKTMEFNDIGYGRHAISIMDRDSCITVHKIDLRGKDCIKDYKIAPLYGEIWEIPFEKGSEGVLRIFDGNGRLVFLANISEGINDVWEGVNNNGEQLSSGTYKFIIKYNNGESLISNITIIN